MASIETVVTFLEMTSRPTQHVPAPANMKLALMRLDDPPAHFYRYLYDMVGREYVWIDRKVLSDEALVATITAPGVDVFVAYAGGVPAGFFELDGSRKNEVWLRYFGLMREYHGRGLGKWLLAEALAQAWSGGPDRVRVETCTLDGPRALPLYQRMGFVPYERQRKVMELPD